MDKKTKWVKVDDRLCELVESIHNRCHYFEHLKFVGDVSLASLLEDLFVDAQTIIDDYCQITETEEHGYN